MILSVFSWNRKIEKDTDFNDNFKNQFVLLISILLLFFVVYYYIFYNKVQHFIILLSFFILIINKVRPHFFILPSYFWFMLGKNLSKFFSPIILSFIYIITIIPMSFIIKIFKIDLINLKYDYHLNSYWIQKNESITNFEKQY